MASHLLLRDQCLQLFQNEDIKRDAQGLLKYIINIIFNEIYPYVLLICIYNVLLLLLVLGIIFLMLHRSKNLSVV